MTDRVDTTLDGERRPEQTEPHPETPALESDEPRSTRRRLLSGFGLALAGFVTGQGWRARDAGATPGDPLTLGVTTNDADTLTTRATAKLSGYAYEFKNTGSGTALFGNATKTSGATRGVYGKSIASGGKGVHGDVTATSGETRGVYGTCASPFGGGVVGENSATSGPAVGTSGRTISPDGAGVWGISGSPNGPTVGVYGSTLSPQGWGVKGVNNTSFGIAVQGTALDGTGVLGYSEGTSGVGVSGVSAGASGPTLGVLGSVLSDQGVAVKGQSLAAFGSNKGVHGVTYSPEGTAVHGENLASSIQFPQQAAGVTGESQKGVGVVGVTASGSTTAGVFGHARSSAISSTGVVGQADGQALRGVWGTATGTSGLRYGIYGDTPSNAGFGVYGKNTATSGEAIGVGGETGATFGMGVRGVSTKTTGAGKGVAGEANSPDGIAVWGVNRATTSSAIGVQGDSTTSPQGVGVRGLASDGIGVWGLASGNGYGVYSQGNAYVYGDLEILGTLTKGGGSFKIDYPVDPENKYLSHSFVESPDMKNVYDGVATLDEQGEATVGLPDWFEVLNRDFRYQLTPIGDSAPNLFVKDEVRGGRFSVSGGPPGLRVSWQVTGIRQDPWAERNRIPVEEDKPDEDRGFYLFPEGYGLPEERSVAARERRQSLGEVA